CRFGGRPFDVKVVFDERGLINALFFVPSRPDWEPPPYADRSRFEEVPLIVDAGAAPLPGTLTLPRGPGPFPVVILVHGSGPHDRDSTIGPQKPFRDLAWGLATYDVASLRYEKRSKAFPGQFPIRGAYTVREEVIQDARAAAALLGRTPRIDPGRIF